MNTNGRNATYRMTQIAATGFQMRRWIKW